jgi:hypothetical protein
MRRLRAAWTSASNNERIGLIVAEIIVVGLPMTVFLDAGFDSKSLAAYGMLFGCFQFGLVVVIAVIARVRRQIEAEPAFGTYTPPNATSSSTSSRRRAGEEAVHFFLAGLGWLLVCGMGAFFGGYVADALFPEDEWAIKWRYSLETDLHDPMIVIEKHPHDCEFLTAPIGDKHCHYDRIATTLRIRQRGVERESSFDDGKTWSRAAPEARSSVFVSWTKVQE